MKVALFIAFHHQYKEWPFVLHSLRNQTAYPDECFLGIDHSSQKAPDPLGFPMKIVRSPKKYDGEYSRGSAINTALKLSKADVVITTDGDCVMCPRFVETYTWIYSGKWEKWTYSPWGTHVLKPAKPKLYRPDDPMKEIYVGPRFFIPGAKKLLPYAGFAHLDALSTKDPHGLRGRAKGTAKILGANMAFPMSAWKLARFPSGRSEDAHWFEELCKINQEYSVRPAPDFCYILHMGESSVQQYW